MVECENQCHGNWNRERAPRGTWVPRLHGGREPDTEPWRMHSSHTGRRAAQGPCEDSVCSRNGGICEELRGTWCGVGFPLRGWMLTIAWTHWLPHPCPATCLTCKSQECSIWMTQPLLGPLSRLPSCSCLHPTPPTFQQLLWSFDQASLPF